MNNELYIVQYPSNSKFAEVTPILAGVDAKQHDFNQIECCPECGQYVSGARWIPPRRVVLTSRRHPDFLYTFGSNVPFLLSERALKEFQSAGLTGIVNAERIDHAHYLRKSKQEVPIPNYYFIEVARSRITIDQRQSCVEYMESSAPIRCTLCSPVPGALMAAKNLHWNMNQYEKYDIFHTYEMGDILFISQRFIDICREKSLTNLHYCLSSQWELGVFSND